MISEIEKLFGYQENWSCYFEIKWCYAPSSTHLYAQSLHGHTILAIREENPFSFDTGKQYTDV